jgi:RNA polymerase sigma-70 factor (ECF subfamily)
MNMPARRDLLQRARRFESAALAEIYDQWSDDLYRYAMRLLGDPNLAEDCVAETYSRFLHALHRGGGPTNHIRAYLYRVAHNWITDYYRSKHPVPFDDQVEISTAKTEDVSEIVHQQLEQARIRDALSRLTPEQRQVITLKYLEGWNNQEVASVMQKPVGAIKSLQHRGLAALKRALHPEGKNV